MKRFCWFANAQPELVRMELGVKNLCDGLEGISIVFLTDTHHSRNFLEPALDALFASIEALKPDLFLIGGDNAESAERQRSFFERVARIRAPLGAYLVPGNNDLECFRGDLQPLSRLARDAGARLLVNEWVRVPVSGGSLLVCGLDDLKRGLPERTAFPARSEPGETRLLLSHNPAALPALLGDARPLPRLALCGHTHGGQIALGPLNPYRIGYERSLYGRVDGARGMERSASSDGARAAVGGAMIAPDLTPLLRMASGVLETSGMTVLISNGVGTSRVPLRVGAPPQLHRIVLRKADE